MRLLVLVGVLLVAGAARADSVLGCQLPDSARKVAELRYHVSEDWERIWKFYSQTYPSKNYPWREIIRQPGIRARHIVNPSGKGWEGINVYEANDEIRLYVVPAESSKTKGKKPGKK